MAEPAHADNDGRRPGHELAEARFDRVVRSATEAASQAERLGLAPLAARARALLRELDGAEPPAP